jgi:hypothetical protein
MDVQGVSLSTTCSLDIHLAMGIPFTTTNTSSMDVQSVSISTASRAGIFKKSMGARHREGIGLSYRPAILHRMAELMPWNRFLGLINVLKCGLCMDVQCVPISTASSLQGVFLSTNSSMDVKGVCIPYHRQQ